MYSNTDILESLEERLILIHSELGPSWNEFYREITEIITDYVQITDRRQLNIATERIREVCCHYPTVSSIVAEYLSCCKRSSTLDNDNITIFEISNRFQSLLDHLEEFKPSEMPKDQMK